MRASSSNLLWVCQHTLLAEILLNEDLAFLVDVVMIHSGGSSSFMLPNRDAVNRFCVQRLHRLHNLFYSRLYIFTARFTARFTALEQNRYLRFCSFSSNTATCFARYSTQVLQEEDTFQLFLLELLWLHTEMLHTCAVKKIFLQHSSRTVT